MELYEVHEGDRVELITADLRVGLSSQGRLGRVVCDNGVGVCYQLTPWGSPEPLKSGGQPYVTVRFDEMITYHPEPLTNLRAV